MSNYKKRVKSQKNKNIALLAVVLILALLVGKPLVLRTYPLGQARLSVDGYLKGLKTVNKEQTAKYLTDGDAHNMNMNIVINNRNEKSSQIFFQQINYKYISGEVKNDKSAVLRYKVSAKSFPDLLSRSGQVSISDIETITNEVEVKLYKHEGKWLITNGVEVFQKIVGLR